MYHYYCNIYYDLTTRYRK